MAFPKGPPKPSSGLFFWLVIAVVSSLLLLLWGWQAGMLGKAGSFLSGLISPAQYAGYGKQTANNDGTGRPAPRAVSACQEPRTRFGEKLLIVASAYVSSTPLDTVTGLKPCQKPRAVR